MLVRTNCWVEDKIVQDGDIALELGHFLIVLGSDFSYFWQRWRIDKGEVVVLDVVTDVEKNVV